MTCFFGLIWVLGVWFAFCLFVVGFCDLRRCLVCIVGFDCLGLVWMFGFLFVVGCGTFNCFVGVWLWSVCFVRCVCGLRFVI